MTKTPTIEARVETIRRTRAKVAAVTAEVEADLTARLQETQSACVDLAAQYETALDERTEAIRLMHDAGFSIRAIAERSGKEGARISSATVGKAIAGRDQ